MRVSRKVRESPVSGKAAAGKKPGRRRGRPAGVVNALLNRSTIIAVALPFTKRVPLAELSVVRVARELGVTPALIHYYMPGGRDALTSGVMNAFYKELIGEWPKIGGVYWREDLEAVASTVYRVHIRYPGVAAYVVSHNKYRMIQEVEKDETDYGLLFFERFTSTVQAIGFDAQNTGIYAHLLVDFITANAHATVRHLWPGEHRDFLDRRLSQLNPSQFPAAHFVRKGLTSLNASEAFTIGLRLFLNALESYRLAGSQGGGQSVTSPGNG
jgi:hypothetical protein